MKDLDDAIRDAGRRHEPPPDWLEQVEARVTRRRRNRRVLAGTVGVALPLAVIIPIVWAVTTSEPTPNGGPGGASACELSIPATGWWRWEGSGDDAVGGMGAVLRGDATFGPGLVGEALTLDGDGDFAEVPDDPALDVGSGDFTVLLWVKFDDTAGEQVLIEKWVQHGLKSKGWTLTKLKDNTIGFYTGGEGGAETERLDIPTSTWIHVALRRSNDSSQIFVDGSLAASGAGPTGDLDSRSSLKLGHRGGSDDTPGANLRQEFFLHGQLDEVELVVGQALSSEQIMSVFKQQSACGA